MIESSIKSPIKSPIKSAIEPESELIERAQAGSVPAFSALVESYSGRLLRFLLTRCPSHADAEDALQDTFVNAFRYLGSYDPQWRFSTWLYRIAIRKAMSQRRDGAVEYDDTPDDAPGPLEACIRGDAAENIWHRARRVLNEEVYAALWLRYVEDMSVRDVAAALSRTQSWTKVNLMRGRRALAAELGDASAEAERVYGEP